MTLCLAACSNNADAPATDVTTTTPPPDSSEAVAANAFPQLYAYLEQQDATFSADSFTLTGESELPKEPAQPLDEARLQPFKPFLIYNADSSRALDMYSYNYVVVSKNGATQLEEGEPDAEASVIDFKKGLRRRIFFGGPGHVLWDARWTAPDQLLMIGAEAEENSSSAVPAIWQLNLKDTSMQVFTYLGTVKADIEQYKKNRQYRVLKKMLKTSRAF